MSKVALVLASASPRRQSLLARLTPAFMVVIPAVDETPAPGETPRALARRLAAAKAATVATAHPLELVLAADTVVVIDGEPLGKPADPEQAAAMLNRLRGRAHRVVTAVSVAASGVVQTGLVETVVFMRAYTDSELHAYVASGDPLDKAGGYAIQHPAFRPAAAVRGCYFNVVGLPLCLTAELLRATDWPTSAARGECHHLDGPLAYPLSG